MLHAVSLEENYNKKGYFQGRRNMKNSESKDQLKL